MKIDLTKLTPEQLESALIATKAFVRAMVLELGVAEYLKFDMNDHNVIECANLLLEAASNRKKVQEVSEALRAATPEAFSE